MLKVLNFVLSKLYETLKLVEKFTLENEFHWQQASNILGKIRGNILLFMKRFQQFWDNDFVKFPDNLNTLLSRSFDISSSHFIAFEIW